MDRLTDSKAAAELKSNYEGLQRVGIEPSVMDLRYVRLAELEEIYPKLVGGIALCKELLRLAMADLDNAEDCDSCIYDSKCCPGVAGDCKFKWKHHDEAMRILEQEENPKSPCYFDYCINCANLIRHTIPGEAGFSEVRCSLKHRGIPMRGAKPSLINIITPENFDKAEEE